MLIDTTVIRVLFHDTNMSHSLIKQICDMEGKDKSNFEMFSSIKPPEPNTLILLGDGLYSMCFSPKGIECCPVLNASPHIKMDFDIWWNEKVVKNVSNGYENPSWMTRKELILGHVNQEGGAHVDGEVDDNINNQYTFCFRALIAVTLYENTGDIVDRDGEEHEDDVGGLAKAVEEQAKGKEREITHLEGQDIVNEQG